LVFTGNTKLEKWSPSSIRRAGLCEDHFPEDCFTATKSLKRNAVPIPFDEVIASDKNIQNDNNKEEQREQREIIQMEQVPHCGQANIERIQSTEVVASTSYLPNANVIADKRSERHPLQYRAARLYFDTSMEEEDITEWMHLEPHLRERVVMASSIK